MRNSGPDGEEGRKGGLTDSSLLTPPCPFPTGSILSVHSQPADTSCILQLPKDAPYLLQPHGAPTWGAIPKLPPPGRSPLAQRPLRRQVSKYGGLALGPGVKLSIGTPVPLVMSRVDTLILPANVYCGPTTPQF